MKWEVKGEKLTRAITKSMVFTKKCNLLISKKCKFRNKVEFSKIVQMKCNTKWMCNVYYWREDINREEKKRTEAIKILIQYRHALTLRRRRIRSVGRKEKLSSFKRDGISYLDTYRRHTESL